MMRIMRSKVISFFGVLTLFQGILRSNIHKGKHNFNGKKIIINGCGTSKA